MSKNSPRRKSKIGMPLLALVLYLVPVFLLYLSTIGYKLTSITILLCIALPIFGLLLGVSSFAGGKEELGTSGMILAILAVAIPMITIALIPLYFMYAVSGALRNM